jgi:Cu+-exporting ATPase
LKGLEKSITSTNKLLCFHCGEDCDNDDIKVGDKLFCCNGCKTVYEMLEHNNLCEYYALNVTPGISPRTEIVRNYDFLDDKTLQDELLDFNDGKISKVTFYIPQMHCSSCIWILENLFKLNSAIHYSEVDFLKKILVVQFDTAKISLKELVQLLDTLGYKPDLNLEGKKEKQSNEHNKKILYKIGVAGFAFGNIMLFSFPEYLSVFDFDYNNIKTVFTYLNLIFSLPVFFYSASEYYVSAIKGLKKKIFNIDVPITLGISVLFFRSLFEIISGLGVGYLDSMTGLVFLLLVGRIFQNKTYETLNFERNYKSYFPIAVTILKDNKETTKPVGKLNLGDRILVKNSEIIPADSVLIKGTGLIDYSFVTGESIPVEAVNGDLIYAGGKQKGGIIELEVVKEVSQSYLTQLWNKKIFDKNYESKIDTLVNIVSKYFTIIILLIASSAALYWIPNIGLAFNAFTAVLIIACPCALALSTPFTLGNTMRIFGRNNFYLKNTNVVERLSSISDIIFDKTGTITETGASIIRFEGESLTEDEKILIKTLVHNSSHPLSRILDDMFTNKLSEEISNFKETPGEGIEAKINNHLVKVGSKMFIENDKFSKVFNLTTKIYLSIDNKVRGFFTVSNVYRKNLKNIIDKLKLYYKLSILSGDNDGEKRELLKFFPEDTKMLFNQSPHQKLEFIESLQNEKGKKILMIGDGLNDAGALKQSNVGISITEETNNFSPACDGLLDSSSFEKLSKFINFCSTSRNIIITSFIISFIYNVVGISIAVQGTLSPLISAILMPLSSITIVIFATLTTNYFAWKRGL